MKQWWSCNLRLTLINKHSWVISYSKRDVLLDPSMIKRRDGLTLRGPFIPKWLTCFLLSILRGIKQRGACFLDLGNSSLVAIKVAPHLRQLVWKTSLPTFLDEIWSPQTSNVFLYHKIFYWRKVIRLLTKTTLNNHLPRVDSKLGHKATIYNTSLT